MGDAVDDPLPAGDGGADEEGPVPGVVPPEISTGPPADEAFQALAGDVRTGVLSTLLEAEQGEADGRLTFSELQSATGADTSAGFAYHLRQLAGLYVRGTEAGYELTYAGRAVARAMAAGTYTESVDRDPVELSDPCPLCGATSLSMDTADNHTSVACGACSTVLLRLPFPPAGQRTHGPAELPRAFDRHNRHRLSLFADGVCPDCGGAVAARVGRPGADGADLPAAEPAPVRATFTCEGCGQRIHSPLTLTVLDHPSVVSFYHDHGEDVTERPLWNVGTEWREGVLSTEPWVARVSSRLDDEVLDLYLDAEAAVRATRREPAS